ncbi:MAG TPA: FAD-binding oxidoreductase [Nocardioides sp.]|nr:FAD-binding oxidoreductase [Nocardioides sp.]
MTTALPDDLRVPSQGPLDAEGRLVHEDDDAAQLALALANVEAQLAAARLGPDDLAELHVRTTDLARLDAVYDVLVERLEATASAPLVTVTEVDRLAVAGMTVALDAVARRRGPHADQHPDLHADQHHPHPHEGPDMTLENTLESRPAVGTESLRGLCSGGVHLPGDAGYDAARMPWNVAVDQRPAAVAIPHSAEEVAAVVRAAASAGLRVAPQSTGHNAAPLAQGGLDDVVLVRLSELTGVTIDPVRLEARVVGGTLWQDVVAAAAEHGLAVMHGSSPDVAVAGYALGGGLSFYGRQHGLAAHQLTAVELVTATGELVRADADHHADLFWALRGGGGNLGVVTALEIRLLPLTDVHAGMLLWDRSHAREVVRAWAAWTREVPESVTTSLRVMSFPPLPELPPFLSGRQLVVIDGAVLEADDRAAELLAPLRALAPEMDTFGRMPATGLLGVHMDPPGPTPAVSQHAMIEALPDEAVDALLAEVGPGSSTSLLFAELRHLGGALARPDTSGALSHLQGAYGLFCVGIAATPEMGAQGLADARVVTAAMAPWSTGGHFLNFTEEQVDTSTGYDPGSWARLQQVRAAADPTGVFVANHRVS